MGSLFLLIEKSSWVFDMTTNYTTLFDMPKELPISTQCHHHFVPGYLVNLYECLPKTIISKDLHTKT